MIRTHRTKSNSYSDAMNYDRVAMFLGLWEFRIYHNDPKQEYISLSLRENFNKVPDEYVYNVAELLELHHD